VAVHQRLREYFQRTPYGSQQERLDEATDLGTKIHILIDADLDAQDVSKLDFSADDWAYVTPMR
jgi:hypothetical protein